MTKRMLSYLRGAGQILDWSGSYLEEAIIEIRNAEDTHQGDARILNDDLEKIGEDLAHVLNNTDPGLINARRREREFVE